MSCFSGNTISALDIINSILGKTGDVTRVDELKYLSCIKDVYRDLNFFVLKDLKHIRIKLNKTNNTIKLPNDFGAMHSLSYEDKCGKLQPIFSSGENVNIVDEKQIDKCNCSCECNTFKAEDAKFESVYESVDYSLSDGSIKNFQLKTSKKIYKDGTVVIIKEHITTLEDGTTIVESKEQELCKLEVEDCGCIKPVENNTKKLEECGCQQQQISTCSKGCVVENSICCDNSNEKTYTVQQFHGRIVLSSNYFWDSIVLTYYAEHKKIKDIQIPIEAKRAFEFGLMYEINVFNMKAATKFTLMNNNNLERLYRMEKDKLRNFVLRLSIDEFKKIVFGKN